MHVLYTSQHTDAGDGRPSDSRDDADQDAADEQPAPLKGMKGKGGHGGWLARAAQIAAYVYAGDLRGAKWVCDGFYNGSAQFARLVDSSD